MKKQIDNEIRRIKSLKDVSDLIRLHNIVWNNSTGIIDLLENSTEVFIFFEKSDKELAGYIFLEADRKGDFMEINDLVIDPAYRRKGFGRLLMNHVMKKYPFIKLNADSSNKKLINFYKSLGFEKDALLENYYSIDKDALRMVWKK